MAGIGSTPELVIGIAAGAAASTALTPALEIPKQDAWDSARNRILNEQLLAALVAKGGTDLGTAHYFAHRNGIDDDQFSGLVYLATTVPGVAEALDLWRRGYIGDGDFRHALVHEGLDQRYIDQLMRYKRNALVGLGDIAYGVVRGILPAPDWVPVAPPAQGDKVPRFPQVNIDPLELANALGFDEEMLKLMVGRSGLSMAPGMAAQAAFRDIIGPNDYLLAIAEGDLRTEWAHAVKEVSRQIPTAHDFIEGHLRGWTDAQAMNNGTALHGMSPEHTDLLYKISGRPVTLTQITKGLARGATYPSTYDDVPEPYRKSLQESNIRPEWADIDYHNRYTYPSGFQVRSETQNGHLSANQSEQLLLEMGWKPQWATHFSQAWAGGTATGADKHVASAQTQLWGTTHRAYTNGELDDGGATQSLTAAGVAPGSIPAVLTLWQEERALVRKRLTPAQVKKAWVEQVPNPETGAAWTRDEALAYLIAGGFDPNDAATFLEL